MRRRIVVLLVANAVALGACGRPLSERPRDGAPVVIEGRPVRVLVELPPVRTDGEDAAAWSPSPAAVFEAHPRPFAMLTPPGTHGGLVGTPSPTPAHVIVATNGAGANLRAGPSTAAPVLATLPDGMPVELLGEPVSTEGRAWRQVRSSDHEGWVVSVVVDER
jgi:hypothetical protein